MEGNYITYSHFRTIERVQEIISENENAFEEVNEIPSRDKLTFTNGYYVNCSVLAIDIRNSSKLPEKHNRPKLAKLYRSFISEAVAVMNGNDKCSEVFIEGDGVIGVFNTPYKSNIDDVFSTGAELSSVVDIINCLFKKNNIEQISVGIGISYGRALMIKSGYRGSGINEVIWLGDVVNESTRLSGYGNKSYGDLEMLVSSDFYNNLNEENRKLLSWNSQRSCYHGNVINIHMNNWVDENRS